jgi:aminodeoxyfutalosine deaminase
LRVCRAFFSSHAKVPLSGGINGYISPVRFIKAVKTFDGEQFLPEEKVLVYDGDRLKDIVAGSEIDDGNVEKLDGILTPGFVNTHCHLELSHMKGVLPAGTSLPEFGFGVVTRRNSLPAEQMLEHMAEADRQMRENGIVAVGDICNTNHSLPVKERSRITYHSFVELIGLHPDSAKKIFSEGRALAEDYRAAGLRASLAAHAPYSVSVPLVKMILAYNAYIEEPFSMHFRESPEETAFLDGKPGGFRVLYERLGIDLSWYKGPENPEEMLLALKSEFPVIMVHNVSITPEEAARLASQRTWFCLCPAANLYIEGKLPDRQVLNGVHDRLCFGTDSLASNDSLDLIKEANLWSGTTIASDSAMILKALTFNGASALNISHTFGKLEPGRRAGLNLVNMRSGKLRLSRRLF